jgi:tetratricopeptide (TPR) repeat protein
MPLPFLVASLHEPQPPKPKAEPAAAVVAPPQPAAASPTVAAAPPAAAPKSAPAETKKPKAVPSAAKPKKPEPKDKAAAAKKLPESEQKNAASTPALAIVADPAQETKAAARRITAVEGTRFELPFEGTGWTYLGDQANREGIAYDSRRFEDTNLVFILNPVKAGDYLLRFQRQDSLRGISYEELVAVSVAPKGSAQNGAAATGVPTPTTAIAPIAAPAATPAAAPAAVTAGANAAPATTKAVIAQPASAAVPLAPASDQAAAALAFDPAALATPEAALSQARSELEAGRVPGALAALDRLIALAPDGTDEECILYGRALERNGPQKDIKRAYAYYKKVRDEYPESQFWDEASTRCSYIERRYFDIR